MKTMSVIVHSPAFLKTRVHLVRIESQSIFLEYEYTILPSFLHYFAVLHAALILLTVFIYFLRPRSKTSIQMSSHLDTADLCPQSIPYHSQFLLACIDFTTRISSFVLRRMWLPSNCFYLA